MNELTGAWAMLTWTSRGAAGEVSHPFGEKPQGILVYTADDTMCSSFMRAGREPLGVSLEALAAARRYWMGLDGAAAPPDGALRERLMQAVLHFNSYGGRYRVEGDRVHHHVEVALFPDWVGQRLTRSWRLDGDRLTLSFATGGRSDSLEWRRLRRD